MPKFLDPTGRPTYTLGICDRCHQKFFLDELKPDPNAPGLLVCVKDRDVLDPYRLPFNPKDGNIAVPRPRPDTDISTDGETVTG